MIPLAIVVVIVGAYSGAHHDDLVLMLGMGDCPLNVHTIAEFCYG
jgi:hypothetical protein